MSRSRAYWLNRGASCFLHMYTVAHCNCVKLPGLLPVQAWESTVSSRLRAHAILPLLLPHSCSPALLLSSFELFEHFLCCVFCRHFGAVKWLVAVVISTDIYLRCHVKCGYLKVSETFNARLFHMQFSWLRGQYTAITSGHVCRVTVRDSSRRLQIEQRGRNIFPVLLVQ